MADSVDFTVHPAIRNGTGAANDCATTSFACPDEPCGCPYTRWALCGLNDQSQADQIKFLTCYDSQNIPYSSDWVTYDEMPNPMQAAQQCAEDLSLNWDAIQTCGGNMTGNVETGNYTEVVGEQSLQLATEASTYFFDTFFKARVGVKFYVPNLYINDVSQDLNNYVDSWSTIRALCNSGANASVCLAAQQSGDPIWLGDSARDMEGKSHHDHTKKFQKFFSQFPELEMV